MLESIVDVVNKFIPDTAAQNAARAELATLLITSAAQEDAAQADIDKTEAAGNFFESGWRPFIGWTCGLVFSGHYIGTPSFLFLRSCWLGVCTVPTYDMAEINNVLYLLLGFGAMRTADKGISTVMKALGK